MLSKAVGAEVPEGPCENMTCGHVWGQRAHQPRLLPVARSCFRWHEIGPSVGAGGSLPGGGAACAKARGRKEPGVLEEKAVRQAGACEEGRHRPGDTQVSHLMRGLNWGPERLPSTSVQEVLAAARTAAGPEAQQAGGRHSWGWSGPMHRETGRPRVPAQDCNLLLVTSLPVGLALSSKQPVNIGEPLILCQAQHQVAWDTATNKTEVPALAGAAPWIGCRPVHGKLAGSIPGQGTGQRSGPGPRLEVCKRQPISVSLPLFLPPFPSL